jgi:exodeoxyribonuclease VII large subunit
MDLFSPDLDEESADTTYRVSELGAELREVVREAFDSVWVAGELQRLTVRPNGHRYFELVEKGARDAIVGKLDAVIWKGDFARIAAQLVRHGQGLAEGLEVRCRVVVDFYPPHGRLQVHVKEIDPVFTLGALARRRQETLDELARQNLLDANRGRALAELPLRVALVTSQGSAAYHDFVATLAESGYGFRLTLVHTAVQGADAERSVASALKAATALPVDCIALVRGGGAKSDLAAFDSRTIALAIARSPVPVLAGLGHEIDSTVADRVAHRSLKTPTGAAQFLVGRLGQADLEVERMRERVVRAARQPVVASRARLLEIERRARDAARTLVRMQSWLERTASALAAASRRRSRLAGERARDLARRLAVASPRAVERRRREPTVVLWRLVGAARGRLGASRERLSGAARLVTSLAPERIVARGFSITRDEKGAIVRSAARCAVGQRLVTTVSDGRLVSRVEER